MQTVSKGETLQFFSSSNIHVEVVKMYNCALCSTYKTFLWKALSPPVAVSFPCKSVARLLRSRHIARVDFYQSLLICSTSEGVKSAEIIILEKLLQHMFSIIIIIKIISLFRSLFVQRSKTISLIECNTWQTSKIFFYATNTIMELNLNIHQKPLGIFGSL